MTLKEHFFRIGFSESDFKTKRFEFEDAELMSKLENNLYFYEKDRNTNTSFYCFNAEKISDVEIKEIRKKIWNQNKADLIIYLQNSSLHIIYVSSNPNLNPIVVNDTDIPLNIEDKQLLDKISKKHIDTGALWLQYSIAVDKIKKQRATVDKELINALKRLRKELEAIYETQCSANFNKRELVQALIDRTLFIKFLEDKKIINSYLFEDCFSGKNFHKYKEILISIHAAENLNKLFEKINNLFNSNLFKTPVIHSKDLLPDALYVIYNTLSGTDESGQLSLFDFQFDVIPIEFISHIYQIFLDDEKAENGIFYTPEGLVDLVLNKTLTSKSGKVLDCACGSGIFLVLAFRKMLENNIDDKDIQQLILKRLIFLKENIFGIEKEYIAWRLTIFSLYLEVLRDIKSDDLKDLIKQNVTNNDFHLFPIDFSQNIIEANTLELNETKQYFSDIEFDYIIGNPPWFTIQNDNVEMLPYWNKYQECFTLEKQASQCFLHKIKSWSKDSTRFGFIVNSSNFLNDSDKFQKFFYSSYGIERFYELSDLKDFLFEFAKEQAVVIIFKNNYESNNVIKFLKPQVTPFTEVFKNVILKEEDIIEIIQKDLLNKKILYRDFYVGNNKDIELINKIASIPLKDYLSKTNYVGMQIWGPDALNKEYKISWNSISVVERNQYKLKFEDKYCRNKKDDNYSLPVLKSSDIQNFLIKEPSLFLSDISNTHRPQNKSIVSCKKVLINRTGNVTKASFSSHPVYFNTDVFGIKLNDDNLYYTITAIFNSLTANYFIDILYRKRSGSAFPKINTSHLINFPIPEYFEPLILKQINKLSKDIAEGKCSFDENKNELNELVFDLYGFDAIERRRIKDFYSPKSEIKKEDIILYCETFTKVFKIYLKNEISLTYEYYANPNIPLYIAGVRIIFSNKKSKLPSEIVKQVTFNINYDMLEKVGNQNFLSLKERIYADNSIFILKDNQLKSWTQTQAYDDAIRELNKLTI